MNSKRGLFEGPRLPTVSLLLLFTLASAFRGFYLGESRLAGERQYRSAIIARALYLEAADEIPEWRKRVASISRRRAGLLEPPILEYLAAIGYRIAGGPRLWLGGLLSSVFWLTGGLALYRVARSVATTEAAVISLAYYLFVPFGVVVSVSFLPEALMVMLLLASVMASHLYHEHPTRRRLLAASLVGGLAILSKPFCLFTVLAVFLALGLARERSWRRLFRPDVAAFLGISLLVGAGYYLYGIFVSGPLATNLRAGFMPMLLFERAYWTDWLAAARRAAGTAPLLVALFGAALLPRRQPLAILAGLLVGYILFGFAYTVPFAGVAYYHMSLVIAVALAVGPPLAAVVRGIARSTRPWIAGPLLGALLVGVPVFVRRDVDTKLAAFRRFVSPQIAREIGEVVGHSTRLVHIASYYGAPLEYFAEVSGSFWPKPNLNADLYRLGSDEWSPWTVRWLLRTPATRRVSIHERFEALDFAPEYLVVADFELLERFHGDVREFLKLSCSLVERGDGYLVYDVEECASGAPAAPQRPAPAPAAPPIRRSGGGPHVRPRLTCGGTPIRLLSAREGLRLG